jgi:hypothetical protein
VPYTSLVEVATTRETPLSIAAWQMLSVPVMLVST